MVAILVPKVTLVRPVHLLNALIPIDVQIGRSMLDRAAQSTNAYSYIDVHIERSMLVIPVCSNVLHLTVHGVLVEWLTLVIPLQFLNAHRPTDAQFPRSRLPVSPAL